MAVLQPGSTIFTVRLAKAPSAVAPWVTVWPDGDSSRSPGYAVFLQQSKRQGVGDMDIVVSDHSIFGNVLDHGCSLRESHWHKTFPLCGVGSIDQAIYGKPTFTVQHISWC